mmetsp:Transcript_21112/g.38340  ORF Transcript_21112/g.38340 Transcript_21112/m.38340 type:complete len:223 (-) Transcript_21112:756-1424(-)
MRVCTREVSIDPRQWKGWRSPGQTSDSSRNRQYMNWRHAISSSMVGRTQRHVSRSRHRSGTLRREKDTRLNRIKLTCSISSSFVTSRRRSFALAGCTCIRVLGSVPLILLFKIPYFHTSIGSSAGGNNVRSGWMPINCTRFSAMCGNLLPWLFWMIYIVNNQMACIRHQRKNVVMKGTPPNFSNRFTLWVKYFCALPRIRMTRRACFLGPLMPCEPRSMRIL